GFESFPASMDSQPAREQAISFAVYRLIEQRFASSPQVDHIRSEAAALMTSLGYDAADTSVDYSSGSPAALGNHIAACYIGYGLQDGANEGDVYANKHYAPVNPPIAVEQ